jgi:ABC-2 type transport system permease protein
VGPGLVSPDLTNNALPLFLSRPFSRTEYILGKITVLVGFLSVLTWVPLLLLFFFKGSLAGLGWMADNVRIIAAVWFGSWAWILVLALLALAFSAWVKWRPVAGFLILSFFLISAGVAEMINEMLSTKWGVILNVAELLKIVWEALFLSQYDSTIPPVWAGLCILAQCAAFLFLLYRRVRAYEVVR